MEYPFTLEFLLNCLSFKKLNIKYQKRSITIDSDGISYIYTICPELLTKRIISYNDKNNVIKIKIDD